MLIIILILSIINFLANLFFGALTLTIMLKVDKTMKSKQKKH